MNNTRKLTLAVGLVLTLAFAACSDNDDPPTAGGGPGSGGGPTVTAEVPASAGTTINGFIDFLLSLASDETSEPYSIGDGFAVPADETSDPRPLT